MNFCPGCGSANLDTDAACRVCGRGLHEEATAQPAASAAPAGAFQPRAVAATDTGTQGGPSGWPAQTGAPAEQDRVITTAPSSRPTTGTATPLGFESAPTANPARSDGALPSFMRPAARGATAQPAVETTSLISENDLPDWIRQIAADDARKAAAALTTEEGPGGVAGSSLPNHLGRRSLPGETITGGPASSSWLNRRDAVAGAASSAWDATTPTPARPVGVVAPAQPAVSQAGSAATADGLSLLPGATETDAVPVAADKPGKRRRRGARTSVAAETSTVDAPDTLGAAKPSRGLASGSAGSDQRRLLLMVAAAVAVVLLLAMMLL